MWLEVTRPSDWCQLGPFLFLGRVPLLKLQKNQVPTYSNLKLLENLDHADLGAKVRHCGGSTLAHVIRGDFDIGIWKWGLLNS